MLLLIPGRFKEDLVTLLSFFPVLKLGIHGSSVDLHLRSGSVCVAEWRLVVSFVQMWARLAVGNTQSCLKDGLVRCTDSWEGYDLT